MLTDNFFRAVHQVGTVQLMRRLLNCDFFLHPASHFLVKPSSQNPVTPQTVDPVNGSESKTFSDLEGWEMGTPIGSQTGKVQPFTADALKNEIERCMRQWYEKEVLLTTLEGGSLPEYDKWLVGTLKDCLAVMGEREVHEYICEAKDCLAVVGEQLEG